MSTDPPLTAVPVIFDARRRALRRDRIARAGSTDLEEFVTDALIERLEAVTRRFDRALVINTGSGTLAAALRTKGMAVDATDHGPGFAARSGATLANEDALPVAAGRYDLVVAASGFDTVNDLPGALVLARRALKPDGLFLAALIGAPTLPVLRRAIVEVDAARGAAAPRLHPLLDVRAAGDLLVRAGFALPVADLETINLSYASLGKLLRDMRDAGMTNVLRQPQPIDREWVRQVAERFEAGAIDGRVAEIVSLLMLTGWSPDASQPKPAARGSGRTSLVDALKPASSPPRPA